MGRSASDIEPAAAFDIRSAERRAVQWTAGRRHEKRGPGTSPERPAFACGIGTSPTNIGLRARGMPKALEMKQTRIYATC